MQIIKTLGDIQRLAASRGIPTPLAHHLERKMAALHRALAPETDRAAFSLALHGPIGILEKGDRSLSAIGLPDSLDQIMPEWVSRLVVDGEGYYILYVMADNDYVVQVYLPEAILEETVKAWLDEQPIEDEGGTDDGSFAPQPF